MILHFLSTDQISELKQIVDTYINFEPISIHDLFVLEQLSPILDLEVAAIGDKSKTDLSAEDVNLYHLRFFCNLIAPPSLNNFESTIEYTLETACCAYLSNNIPTFISHYNLIIQEPKEWDKLCLYTLCKCWLNLLTNTNITYNIDMIHSLRENQKPFEQDFLNSLSPEEKTQMCCELISHYHMLKVIEVLSLKALDIIIDYNIEQHFQQSQKIHYNQSISVEIFKDWIYKMCYYLIND